MLYKRIKKLLLVKFEKIVIKLNGKKGVLKVNKVNDIMKVMDIYEVKEGIEINYK